MLYSKQFLIAFYLLLSATISLKAEELPRATTSNCFYIMPLFEFFRIPGNLTYEEKRSNFIKMKLQLGNGNLYHRLGFSGIYGTSVDNEWRDNCKLAAEYGTHVGLIFATQSHTRNNYRAIAALDLRLFQWRKDGIDWKGSYTSSGNLEVPEDERDYKIPTPSRYATSLRTFNHNETKKWAVSVRKLMNDYPGVVTCVNGPIEEELALGGNSNPDKLADYSPFAITEFRDWLRHTGMYDATTGKYAGEGANKFMVGNFITINGVPRSQFYDDPTPANSNGTGQSFNSIYGTNFSTWKLRYWDLENYTNPITNESFDCTPETGEGFTDGGFDAPRVIDGSSIFWQTWSYDVADQGGYPLGNPITPAYGFRQNMVRNFVRDLMDVIAAEGIPREIMYAHQIPGEALSSFTGSNGRLRSSASTIWSGFLEKSNTVGITRFATIDPALMTQYAGDWGIFEWHTSPNTDKNSQVLYDKSKTDLDKFYANKCHYLFPGWWKHVDAGDLRFPLNDSKFATAIGDFMKTRAEVPYNRQTASSNFTPPLVTGVYGYLENNNIIVNWSSRIWADLANKWSEWGGFSNFEFQKSTDGVNWGTSTNTAAYQISQPITQTSYKVRVCAVSKTGLKSAWSNVITIDVNSPKTQFALSAEFSTIEANAALQNRITITLDDVNQTINPATLEVSITGNGNFINTEPANISTIEKYWPMNASTEVQGINKMDNTVFSDGFFQFTVSATAPIDPYFTFVNSKFDGSLLPYFSFRMYSDMATQGQLFCMYTGGNKSKSFDMQKGWNTYSFANVPEWMALTSINSVRFDPGNNNPSGKIKLDWMAISSQPILETLKAVPTIIGNTATILTAPTSVAGSYTVSVTINGSQKDILIQTSATSGVAINQYSRSKHLLFPNPAKDVIRLQSVDYENTSISISTLNGQIVKSKKFSALEEPILSINELSRGIYIVQIGIGSQNYTEKLIKL